MVMAQVLFSALRQDHPHCRIDVLAPEWTAPLLARMPEVTRPVAMPIGHGRFAMAERRRLGLALRAEHYDRAIVLPGSWKSALVPYFAKIPQRTGYVGELRWGLLNDARRLDKSSLPRTVDRFVALGLAPHAAMPLRDARPRLCPDAANGAAAMARLGLASDGGPLLALCPGAEYGPAKQWPAAHFASVARWWEVRGGRVWLFGSSQDAPMGAEIAQRSGAVCIDLCGRTTLAEAVDLLALAAVVVSNDSGLMHVAAALDKPVVALYGSSDPRVTPPLHPAAQVLRIELPCAPCFARTCRYGHTRCLTALAPEQVMAALAPAG